MLRRIPLLASVADSDSATKIPTNQKRQILFWKFWIFRKLCAVPLSYENVHPRLFYDCFYAAFLLRTHFHWKFWKFREQSVKLWKRSLSLFHDSLRSSSLRRCEFLSVPLPVDPEVHDAILSVYLHQFLGKVYFLDIMK